MRHSKPFARAVQAVAVIAAGFIATVGVASATPVCLANPSCTLDGQTFTTTGGTSGGGLTFLASFTTKNQSNSEIAMLVTDYLALLGDKVTYLGRQDGSGLAPGIVSITTSNTGGLSGTWMLNAGTTGFIGDFVAIHAGNGQSDNLFAIDSPGTSGTWATNNGKGLSNFDLFGMISTTKVPEPGTLALLGIGLIAIGLLSRRRSRRC